MIVRIMLKRSFLEKRQLNQQYYGFTQFHMLMWLIVICDFVSDRPKVVDLCKNEQKV